eukprot:355165-Chlamydomonas_euryale.AAC.4
MRKPVTSTCVTLWTDGADGWMDGLMVWMDGWCGRVSSWEQARDGLEGTAWRLLAIHSSLSCAGLLFASAPWHCHSKARAAMLLLVQMGTVGGRSTTELTPDGVPRQREGAKSSSVHTLHRKIIGAFLL